MKSLKAKNDNDIPYEAIAYLFSEFEMKVDYYYRLSCTSILFGLSIINIELATCVPVHHPKMIS
jgi:hypothetical protein